MSLSLMHTKYLSSRFLKLSSQQKFMYIQIELREKPANKHYLQHSDEMLQCIFHVALDCLYSYYMRGNNIESLKIKIHKLICLYINTL